MLNRHFFPLFFIRNKTYLHLCVFGSQLTQIFDNSVVKISLRGHFGHKHSTGFQSCKLFEAENSRNVGGRYREGQETTG
ncbi:unnamed protein product, partial [Vitis vinifera]